MDGLCHSEVGQWARFQIVDGARPHKRVQTTRTRSKISAIFNSIQTPRLFFQKMAASLVATALQAIAMLPLLFLLYLAGKMGYILFKNILDRRAIEAAGVYVPKGDGYTWLKGHMDLFVTKGGSFTAVCAYLDKERPDVPDTFVTYISLFATILVSRNPEVAAQVLLRKNYPKDSYDSIKPIVGMGLLTTGGDHWVKKRRIMNHGFVAILDSIAVTNL